MREWDQFKVRDDLAEALSALDGNDHQHATELWTKALERNPREARASPLAVKVLVGLRRFDEAETIMREGQIRHPNDMRFARGLAEIARDSGDDETALLRWVAVRKQFPGDMIGYAAGVGALRKLNRLSEAETLAERTMKLFPEEVLGFMEHAQIASLRQHWDDALRRWDLVRTRFDHSSGYLGAARAMIQLGRYDEAEALLSQCRIKTPTDSAPVIELARCAEARGDLPGAIDGWNRVAQRFSLHLPSCLAAASALQTLDAFADSENVLRDAIDHFPNEPRPLAQLGMLFLDRRNFPAAVNTFATMRSAFPDREEGYIYGAQALSQTGCREEAEALRGEHHRRLKSRTLPDG
jgi:tetratricopeptide (TPR) repeat protein